MLATLLKELKEYKTPSFITPICMILEVICEMVIPLLMASIVDIGVYGGDFTHIWQTGLLMVVVAIIGLMGGLLGAKFGSVASAGFAHNLRETMFEKIQTYSFANIDKYSTSGLVTRLTTDVSNIQNAYMMILRMCFRAPISLITAMVLAFLISPRIASIYLVAVIILGVILFLITRKTMGAFSQVFQKYDDLNESVQENVSAIRVVKAYVREDYETEKFQKASGNIYKLFVNAEKLIALNSPIMMSAIYICILLISYMGAQMCVSDTLTTGNLMSLLTYCTTILMNLMMLSMIFVMVTMSIASMKRVAEVLNEVPSLSNPETPDFEVVDGSIKFEHVNFGYYKTAEEYVLNDINLEIKSGETIGIIGGTGSAKTSLVNLISRLYDVSEGSVYVGGKDVRSYDLETLRDKVSVVLQKNVLFSGTILDNLRWGDENASEEECKRACELACADEFIQNMPEKYNTFIEQGGTNVSGGQR